jgi:hypothetical protein
MGKSTVNGLTGWQKAKTALLIGLCPILAGFSLIVCLIGFPVALLLSRTMGAELKPEPGPQGEERIP